MSQTNIKNIAQQAGVSLATVSRVINNSAKVSDEKVQRVRKAASGLGYRLAPKPPAKVCFKTRNVALVYAGWSMMQLNEWGFMDGLESVFSQNDLRLMLVRMPEDGMLPSVFTDQACDGILTLADLKNIPTALIQTLEKFPCIQMIHGNARQHFGDEVFCDNLSVAGMAFDYLKQAGVKRYAFFNVDPSHYACQERQAFFDFYLRQENIPVTHLVAKVGDALTRPSHVLANELVKKMLAMKTMPDGLFVPVDFQLPELYTALISNGIKPMQDIQIISCDNCERHLVKVDPRPATIDLRIEDLGRYAARQLIWRIEHPDDVPVRLYIKPELIMP